MVIIDYHIPILWAYDNHGSLEPQDRVNTQVSKQGRDKSIRLHKVLYLLSNVHRQLSCTNYWHMITMAVYNRKIVSIKNK